MTAPKRVQRTRIKGQPGIPAGAVYVGRGPGSRWGNPFRVDDALEVGMADTTAEARKYCTDTFRAWLNHELDGGAGPKGTSWSAERRDWILTHLPDLAGRDLSCWCPLPDEGQPDHCHAAVLIELAANAPKENPTP